MGGYIQGLLSFSPSNRLKKQTKKKVQNPKKAKVEKKEEKKKSTQAVMGSASWLSYWIHKEVIRRKKYKALNPTSRFYSKELRLGTRLNSNSFFIGLYGERKEKAG